MQAILVLDSMPINCVDCPLRLAGLEMCGDITSSIQIRPAWCPLVEAPKRIVNPATVQKSWNKCLDMIGVK